MQSTQVAAAAAIFGKAEMAQLLKKSNLVKPSQQIIVMTGEQEK